MKLAGDGLHLQLDFAHRAPSTPGQEAQKREPLPETQPRHDQGQRDVPPHRHVRVERVALEDHRDPALVRPQLIDGPTPDRDRALALALQACHDADQGRFPAAGRTHERQELAVPD